MVKMMKRIILFLCMLFIMGMPLSQAEWLYNGVPVTDSPYAKTAGEFGAMLIFTDKPDELFTAWNKDTPEVSASFDVEEIKQYDSLTAAIIFSNCAPDEKGMANVTVKFKLLDPNGKIMKETEDLEVWINKPAPDKRMLELSVQFLAITLRKNDIPGFYTVKALVHDRNSDIKLNLERKFKMVASK